MPSIDKAVSSVNKVAAITKWFYDSWLWTRLPADRTKIRRWVMADGEGEIGDIRAKLEAQEWLDGSIHTR